MNVTSLKAACIGTCIENIEQVRDLGEMPFTLIEPILRAVQSPEQLLEIQEHSPHLAVHTADLWQKLIRRDFPKYDRDPIAPKNPLSWHKVYRKLKMEQDALFARSAEKLKEEIFEAAKAKLEQRVTFLPGVILPHNSGSRAIRSRPSNNRARATLDVYKSREEVRTTATSIAMKKVQKQAQQWQRVAGPRFTKSAESTISVHKAQQPHASQRVTAIVRHDADAIKFNGRFDKATGRKKSINAQGAGMLDSYIRSNGNEIAHKRDLETEVLLSPLRLATTSPSSASSRKSITPIRRPGSSDSSSTASNKNSPIVMKSLISMQSIPELSLADKTMPAAAAPAAHPPTSRKMSLQEYSRKRKAADMEK